MAMVIETKGLTKAYGNHTAVDHLDLEVQKGEIFGFLGPNGAGKTTTLLMLLGLSEPSFGTASVLGFDPCRNPLQVKSKVGYLPENVGFYPEMTAGENLAYVARLNNVPEKQVNELVMETLLLVGLADEAAKKAGAYSRGMRQRLGIAEVLIKKPELVFLDEPTLGLDPDGINRMLDLIVDLNREQNITVLLSSHHLHQVQRICTQVGIMSQGDIIAQGGIKELAQQIPGRDGEPESTLEQIYMRYFKEA
ncbi:hypothetical protein X474_18110 [Dethiosulfatarculus sandiegensis]|uniref:ABC transporter domain-containing protein n=2 Tax=Dethiosulfatarculus sandiegensis TaxID=1429043 RepID=A0A0D2HPY3_9BACT|nr:ABC transporter ATP-binding protein [Dethiosulfatarculus sandiegensis]KIX12518.1 hypothetical protein X474_18110 [Dethiosulfatarculus sandiegensis]